MSTPNSPLTLPIVTIDPQFSTVIHEVDNGIIPSDQFWISCYKTSHPSVHAKIHVELDDSRRDVVNLTANGGDVQIFKAGDRTGNFAIACPPLSISPTQVTLPVQEYSDPERSNSQSPHRITAFDIAPDVSKFATGFLDGSVFIYPTTILTSPSLSRIPQPITITSKTTSRSHLSSVTSLKFFPSSRVLLSSSADFSVTILPADISTSPSPTGTRITPARTLRAHTRAITSINIIGVGRNVLSSSLDSTIKLWDVSSGAPISSFSTHSPILSSSLGDITPIVLDGREDVEDVPDNHSEVVFCGLQNGAFEIIDLNTKSSIYRSNPRFPASLTSVGYSHTRSLLATGTSEGVVTLYDTRSLATPLTSFKRNSAGIEDLQFTAVGKEVGLAIATADGLPYLASLKSEMPTVSAELVGGDCDAVRNVRVRRGAGTQGSLEVWSAGDDAIVRRYFI